MRQMRRVGDDVGIADRVMREIVGYIRDNRLRPGDRLPTEGQLCESLGVSRTAVREALRGLKDRGLVLATPGRGSFVAAPDASILARNVSSLLMLQECSIDDVFEVRRSLEVFLAGLAAHHADDVQLKEIDHAFQLVQSDSITSEQALLADRDFHVAIAMASGNRLGAILVDAMMLLTMDMRRKTFALDPDFPTMHKVVWEKIHSRKEAQAREGMSQHFDMISGILGRTKAGPKRSLTRGTKPIGGRSNGASSTGTRLE